MNAVGDQLDDKVDLLQSELEEKGRENAHLRDKCEFLHRQVERSAADIDKLLEDYAALLDEAHSERLRVEALKAALFCYAYSDNLHDNGNHARAALLGI